MNIITLITLRIKWSPRKLGIPQLSVSRRRNTAITLMTLRLLKANLTDQNMTAATRYTLPRTHLFRQIYDMDTCQFFIGVIMISLKMWDPGRSKTFKKFGAHNLKGLLKGLIQKTASSTLCLQVARWDCMNGRPAKRFEPEVQLHQSYDLLWMDRLCSPSQSQCWCVRCLGNESSV